MCHFCRDCGAEIHRRPGARGRLPERCPPCKRTHNLGRSASNNAKRKRPHFCIDCGIEVFPHPDAKKRSGYPKRCDPCRAANGEAPHRLNAHRPSGEKYVRKCVVCMEEFATSQSSQNVCGDECRAAYRRKGYGKYRLVCQQCGGEFDSHRGTQKCCSPECSRLATRKRVTLTCANDTCGNQFETTPRRIATGHRYCSKECWCPRRKDRVCQNPACGKLFKPKHRQSQPWQNNGKYCCPECYRDHHFGMWRPRLPGVGGSSRYALQTGLRKRCKLYDVTFDPACTREAVLDRDKWKCQGCGVQCHKDYVRNSRDPRYWTQANHDHIVPLSLGPTKSPGNVFENSQCLCKRCNTAKGDKPSGQLRLCIEEEAWGKGVRVRSLRNSKSCVGIPENAI